MIEKNVCTCQISGFSVFMNSKSLFKFSVIYDSYVLEQRNNTYHITLDFVSAEHIEYI